MFITQYDEKCFIRVDNFTFLVCAGPEKLLTLNELFSFKQTFDMVLRVHILFVVCRLRVTLNYRLRVIFLIELKKLQINNLIK